MQLHLAAGVVLAFTSAALTAQIAAPLADAHGGCTLQPTPGDGVSTGSGWTNAVVPYAFEAAVTPAQQSAMQSAMQQLMNAANVHFQPRAAETDYVLIRDSSLNSSAVGRVGGMQVLHVLDWQQQYVLVHELMHVLGFWHEHQRPDRDQFVTVQWANVLPAQTYEFQVVPTAQTFGAYDFDSVMHFAAATASSNSQPTLLVLPPNQQQQNNIGQRTHLSTGDVDALRFTFGSAVPPTITSLLPGTTTAWQSGNLLLQGLLFDEVLAVQIGALRVTTFTRPQPDQVQLPLPAGLLIGAVPVQVESRTGLSNAVPLQVTGNDPPVVQGPTVAVRGTFLNTFRVHADDVRTNLLLVSFAQQPSTVPGVVQLGIGAQFSNLAVLGGPMVGDATGVATFTFRVPTTVPTNNYFYLQSLLFDPVGPTLPLSSSNVLPVRTL